MTDLDAIDYTAMDRFWSVDEWYRFEDAARISDPGPRGVRTAAGVQTRLAECTGEVEFAERGGSAHVRRCSP